MDLYKTIGFHDFVITLLSILLSAMTNDLVEIKKKFVNLWQISLSNYKVYQVSKVKADLFFVSASVCSEGLIF